MDSIDALSKVSGVSREGVLGIAREVKENRRKLESCPGPHKFTIPAGKRKFADDFICETCGGRIGPVDKLWYERGLQHGALARTE